MFNDIRSRLIISHLAVSLIIVIILFLSLVLVTRPLQTRLTQLRLNTELNQLTQLLQQRLEAGTPARSLLQSLTDPDLVTATNVLILDSDRVVVFDSLGLWTGFTFPEPVAQNIRRSARGRLTGPDGQQFLYAARVLAPPTPPSAAPFSLVLTTPTPGSSFLLLSELSIGLIVAATIALLLAVLLSILIARWVARPLQDMARAAEAVARQDYSRTVPERGPTEVRQVSRSFNSMVGQVRAGRQAMQDFVSNVSHELKTPLTSIQGFSQALLEGAAQDAAARQRSAAIIHDEAQRMRRLVEELLDLARIESGQLVIGKNPIDLPPLLDMVLNNLSLQAQQKQLQLQRDYALAPGVVGDGDRLTQVFTNLLDNAIKHTPPGGQVTIQGRAMAGLPRSDGTVAPIRGRPQRRYAQVVISDTGPGIPEADLPRIFERFYQVDKSRPHGRGTGLGLAIAYNIVRAHGGRIVVASQAGQGTQFTVWLPTNEADASTLVSRRRSRG